MTENQTEIPGAAGEPAVSTPTPDPAKAAPSTTPTMEYKDGAVFADGKKMVKESDLMALKQSSESAAEKAQAAHNEAVDTVRLELSTAQQALADSNAKLTEAQEAQGKGATTNEDVARIEQERNDALAKVETLTVEAGKALELKKALLIAQYPGVTVEKLADKTMTQLDSLEEALKAVSSTKGGGIGGYAVGGGLGAAVPQTDYERRQAALASAPVGTRTAVPEQK